MASHLLYGVEIPVSNMERAQIFYASVLQAEIRITQAVNNRVAFLPHGTGPFGALVQGPEYNAGVTGVVVYLHVNEDLDIALLRVKAAGGRVLMEKTAIGPNGYVAYILDSEGNKIGLHGQ